MTLFMEYLDEYLEARERAQRHLTGSKAWEIAKDDADFAREKLSRYISEELEECARVMRSKEATNV